MKISCLLVSHNKPDYVHYAINSVIEQIHQDWQLIIMDSGKLLDEGYFDKYSDARIEVYASGETEELKKTKAMAPWCFNECFRRGLVDNDLAVYLCDDDIFYPCAFEVFSRWATNNPQMLAMYGSEDVAAIYFPGKEPVIYGHRKALEIGGRGAYPMDCRVDYLQLCHRLSVLKHFDDANYWPEEKETEKHADGVFMERLGEICHIYPIPVRIGQNRRTTVSTYYPVRSE